MKLSKDDLEEIITVLGEIEALRPIIKTLVENALSVGTELKPVVEALSKFLVQNRVNSIKAYRAAGFSQADAITMTMDEAFAVRRLVKNV